LRPRRAFKMLQKARRNKAGSRRIYESISKALPHARVFRDVQSIRPGEDFVDVLNEQLESCLALLLVIGPNWLKVGNDGRTNLDNPNDFSRLEIETAIRRNIPLIPILVDNAEMPTHDQIPECLSQLERQQNIRINDEHYALVVEDLVLQLSKLVASVPLDDQLDHPAGAVRANTSATNDASTGKMLLETAISKLRTGNLKPWAWISLFIVTLVAWKCGYFPEVSFNDAASIGRKLEGMAGDAIQHIHIRRLIP
jgi:hypothetical protein